MSTTIVYGPQGCGKSNNALALAASFDCSAIVENWNGRDALPDNALALTNCTPPFASVAPALLFDAALVSAAT
jgi:hypothetical protein